MMFGPGSPLRVIGHRGAAGVAPENTLTALRHAVATGAHAVEIDIHCTADGRLVVLHDATVDRTTDGSGSIESMTLEEARRLDAGYRFTSDRGATFPFRGRGIRIPTLEEAFAVIDGLYAVVEIKSRHAGAALPDWLSEHGDWLSEHGACDRILAGAFSRKALRPVERSVRWRCATEEELRAYVLLGKIGFRPAISPSANALMIPERHRGLRVVTPRLIRRAHADGLGVFVWTVNRPDAMRRLWDWGVDGLISDDPGRALRIAQERIAGGIDLPPGETAA